MIYTIPSLALFQLLVPVTGLTVTTVEIALVSYTMLILFRNTLAGLRSVPPEVLEAARGMGLTRNQTLWRVELPLAVPAIIAGLRIAVVSTIALATVAAFVVSKGLGGPILGALRLDFRTEIIAAGALAVGLAIIADVLLVLVERAGDAVGGDPEDGMILAALDVFANSLDFIVDQRAPAAREDLGAHRPVGGGARGLDRRRRPDRRRCSATCTAARSSPSTSRTSAAPCRRSS